jgi:ATP-binding cassette subfamily B protein
LLVVPVGLIVGYGLLRLSSTLFTELRNPLLEGHAERGARDRAAGVPPSARAVAALPSGSADRGHEPDIERGTRGIQSLISYSLYSILPTLVEMSLVIGFFVVRYDIWFAAITICALAGYIVFTIVVTEWRTHFRRKMNELDSRANQKAIDSLLNFETVKYFGNEEYEARRYDENLRTYRTAAIRSQNSLSFLNFGQQAIIALGLILILWRATVGVAAGKLTLGDLVLVNTLMIQPISRSTSWRDLSRDQAGHHRHGPHVRAARHATGGGRRPARRCSRQRRRGALPPCRLWLREEPRDPRRRRFHDRGGHDNGRGRPQRLGQVHARAAAVPLLRRHAGRIEVDGQDIRRCGRSACARRSASCRRTPCCSTTASTTTSPMAARRPRAREVIEAARAAQIDTFISELPQGYDTPVASGPEAVRRREATRGHRAHAAEEPADPGIRRSHVGARLRTEQAIQAELMRLAQNRTTLLIAHRLSTVVHADQILVMDHGRIIERGTHAELMRANGHYAEMWQIQARNAAEGSPDADALAIDVGDATQDA